MDYDLILIRYGELSLKSSYVRKQFKSALVRNIKNALERNNVAGNIKTERGRIYIYTDEIKKGLDVLKNVFGITSFSPVVKTTSSLVDMISVALKFCKKTLNKDKSFALRVKRTGNHELSSQDFAVKIGSEIVNVTKAKVDLSNPDFELFIEIRNENAFFFTEKIRGTGGLPLGTQGIVLSLIDTPRSLLAAWYLMRRGCDTLFLITNNQISDTLHLFITNWYVELDIIESDSKEKNLYKTVNNVVSEGPCSAIVTGHTLYDSPQDVLSDIKQFKKHVDIPILHPLIAMNLDEIDKKCMKLGIKI